MPKKEADSSPIVTSLEAGAASVFGTDWTTSLTQAVHTGNNLLDKMSLHKDVFLIKHFRFYKNQCVVRTNI